MVKFLKLFFATLLIFYTSSFAQNISVSAYTDTTDYQVGDYIHYTLELRYDKDIKIFLPPIKDSIKVLEFIESLPSQKKELDGKILEIHRFIFSKYDSTEVTIPSIPVYYSSNVDTVKKVLLTNPVTVSVHTLEVNPQEDIRDVKEPLKLPLNWWLIILLIIAIILFTIGIYYLYKYYKKKKIQRISKEPEIVIPPHEIALAELKILEDKKLWQQGMIKEYHSQVTGIIRKYFEYRFRFSALELTSPEILGCLSYLDDGKKILNISEQFFSNADLVKFAKFEPMPSINEEMMKQAYQIVNDTIPMPEPTEAKEEQNV